MLIDAELGEETGVNGKDFGGGLIAKKIAEEDRNALDDGRFGVGLKVAAAGSKVGDEPGFGEAAGKKVGLGAKRDGQRRGRAALLGNPIETVLRVGQGGEGGLKGLEFLVNGDGLAHIVLGKGGMERRAGKGLRRVRKRI